ncbi:phage tail assembly chaperone G [Xenorhabdus thuongxuanensis]|uniref:Tail assembly protein G domain-containing protein n=1 Tax=Xenorhabdus thuongxuanensis TaxID=1873484 RepID=A0A1Q5U3R2_9GAMM|nr:phage minor tail protein G [Xenorhabdus thuongxuanensis]OKP07119.1 hypothetical protein Xentx_01723 [Xenorhabdus thuongxuanensis]
MFLKQGEFTYGGMTLSLSELSALQRIEYFDFLVLQSEQAQPEDEAKRTVFFARMNVESHAWLVSRSLWHAEGGPREIDALYRDVLSRWSPKALEAAAQQVLLLSDMTRDEETTEATAEPLEKS